MNERVAYPADWPAFDAAKNCAPIAGTFENRSSDTTLWHRPGHPEDGVDYLSRLITRDAMQAAVQAEVITAVKLDTAKGTLVYKVRDWWTADNHFPAQSIACGADGRWRVEFDDRTQSEGSMNSHARNRLVLLPAVDGSLVIKSTFDFRGGISGGHAESWMLFAAAKP